MELLLLLGIIVCVGTGFFLLFWLLFLFPKTLSESIEAGDKIT